MTVDLRTIKSVTELTNELRIRIYDSQFETAREYLTRLPEALRNFMLFTDFDTEVIMGGILTFLENSAGAYLPETIETFEAIGARENAIHLTNISNIMKSFGVTHEGLRQGFAGLEEYDITTFEKMHGKELNQFADAIRAAAKSLYLYEDTTREDVYELFERYVERHREEIIAAVVTING